MKPTQTDQHDDQGFHHGGQPNGSRQDGRGGQNGGGDGREQQDQEELDRDGQRHGQHSDRDKRMADLPESLKLTAGDSARPLRYVGASLRSADGSDGGPGLYVREAPEFILVPGDRQRLPRRYERAEGAVKLIGSLKGTGWLQVGTEASNQARYNVGVWLDHDGVVYATGHVSGSIDTIYRADLLRGPIPLIMSDGHSVDVIVTDRGAGNDWAEIYVPHPSLSQFPSAALTV
jgi:hypothetical protein